MMHIISKGIWTGTLVAISLAACIPSVLAADAQNGKRLAERWCSSCHVVTAAQQQAAADAPPFSEIAKRPDFSAEKIAMFLLDPHAKMPNMGLSRLEAVDLAGYIATLAR
jgi:mono/diheme cytochrome c family protein